MSFDPNKPVAGAEIDAMELRAQFNGLKDLLDAQAAQIASLTAQLADKVSLSQHAVDHSTVLNTINSAVAAALAQTARDPTTVFADNYNVTDPVAQPEGERGRDNFNTLLTALKRN